MGDLMSRAATAVAVVQPAERKPRTRPVIDTVRNSTLALVNCNSYLPADLIRKVKMAAIDRDIEIRLLNDCVESAADWPGDVVPISGASGVIAQVLRDHFASIEALRSETAARVDAVADRATTRRRRRTRS